MPGPSAAAHQVLVYSGPGVSPLSLSHTVLTLSLLLLPHYTVQPVTTQVLDSEPWEQSCALIVFPGGRDLPFVEELTMKTKVTRRIREYVTDGGRYLGICAGAYFGSKEVRFDVGGPMEVKGDRDLAFYPGSCTGPAFPGFAYAAESGARAVSLFLERIGSSSAASSSRQTLDHLYYNGGGYFTASKAGNPAVSVLARYADKTAGSESDENAIAAVLTRNGKGKALLCAVHFEYPLNDPPAKDAIAKMEVQPNEQDLEASETARIEWVIELLRLLDLKPPGRSADGTRIESAQQGGKGQEEDPALLLHPTHPSPVFILPLPVIPEIGSSTFASPALHSKLSEADDGYRVLRDANDELRITDTASFGAESSAPAVTAELARRRRDQPKSEDPAIENLKLEDGAEPPLPQPPDFHALPKTIVLPSADVPYQPSWTPLFNFETYWSELEAARKRTGKKHGSLKRSVVDGKQEPSLGDQVWYAETVTSTQTMLDRNPLLLTNLPTPLSFLASFQLSGRGRGSNIWLSPPGCLQFSLLLTLPQSMSSKLVFVQYLMALAVCEAVDDDGRLGVRIKWPNDLYAEVEGVGDSQVGSGKKGRAKLGGILVNTNFVGGQWRLVVGCGFNVLNALPTTSLSQLHSLLSARTPLTGSGKPLPPAPTMEGTFAKIMNAFESKWEQFIEDKGFTGLEAEYYGRWLHSGQEVTLTTVEPHQRLRIQGITPDYGLLRCIPLDKPSGASSGNASSRGLTPLYTRGDFGGDDRSTVVGSGAKPQYVDLQPDGNSFDLMSGLIKRKI